MKRARVKGWVVAGMFLAVSGGAPPFSAAQTACDQLSCEDLCKDEKKACNTLRTTLRDWLQVFCDSDASDATFDCVDAKTVADEDCALLCDDEFKDCKATNKTALRQCKNEVKTIRAFCKADMRFELSDARSACGREFDACKADCP